MGQGFGQPADILARWFGEPPGQVLGPFEGRCRLVPVETSRARRGVFGGEAVPVGGVGHGEGPVRGCRRTWGLTLVIQALEILVEILYALYTRNWFPIRTIGPSKAADAIIHAEHSTSA